MDRIKQRDIDVAIDRLACALHALRHLQDARKRLDPDFWKFHADVERCTRRYLDAIVGLYPDMQPDVVRSRLSGMCVKVAHDR